MKEPGFAAIILAAGEGTRMRSATPKVLHEIAGRPMLFHVLAALRPLSPSAVIAVLGPGMGQLAATISPSPDRLEDPFGPVSTAVQPEPRGTGDAVRAAKPVLAPMLLLGGAVPPGIADVVVLFGDTPLLRPETIARLIDTRRSAGAAVAVAGMRPADPGAYGRLVLGPDDGIERIVEARDASEAERAIGLCNGGIMAIEARRL